eukprot:459988-Pyramimonas_sp.AAC.2
MFTHVKPFSWKKTDHLLRPRRYRMHLESTMNSNNTSNHKDVRNRREQVLALENMWRLGVTEQPLAKVV